jgi:hypothetical protein
MQGKRVVGTSQNFLSATGPPYIVSLSGTGEFSLAEPVDVTCRELQMLPTFPYVGWPSRTSINSRQDGASAGLQTRLHFQCKALCRRLVGSLLQTTEG